MNASIRKEQQRDHAEVRELLIKAFGQPDEALLVERIRKSPFFIPELSLVAESPENEILGYILFSIISIEHHKSRFPSLALAPVAVMPEHQHQGIGGQLIMAGIDKATRLGHESVILLGHADYYPRFGFEPTRTWDIICPFEVPEENYMAIELVPNGLKDKSGLVMYPDVWELWDQSQ